MQLLPCKETVMSLNSPGCTSLSQLRPATVYVYGGVHSQTSGVTATIIIVVLGGKVE